MGLTSTLVVAVIIVSVVQSGKLGLEIDILELHVQNKLLVCSIDCPCSHWLFHFSVLHSKKTLI